MKIRQEFLKRRQSLLQKIEPDSVVVLFAAKEVLRNGDLHHVYRQDSDFYYLTGFAEPDSIAVLIPGRIEGEYLLFSKARDLEAEQWTGGIVGQERAIKDYGANQSYPISEAVTIIPELLSGKSKIYANFGIASLFDSQLFSWVGPLKGKARAGINMPLEICHIAKITHEMRMIKDNLELEMMRKACAITAEAQLLTMKRCCTGMMEYELESILEGEFIRQGARQVAFPSIVASGRNTCILHYGNNDQLVQNGSMVLVDAGAEYENYAADITRSYPANGKFSVEQRAIYQAVLDAQLAAIEKVSPGVEWIELLITARKVVTAKLVELGILHGAVDELYSAGAYERFFMHNIGHWLGLDVHDVGRYKPNDHWRYLAPGMVFTVEPGIYIPENMMDVDKKWWNIGVRIEDDVLVTETGCEVLTSGAPKTVEEIEAAMKIS